MNHAETKLNLDKCQRERTETELECVEGVHALYKSASSHETFKANIVKSIKKHSETKTKLEEMYMYFDLSSKELKETKTKLAESYKKHEDADFHLAECNKNYAETKENLDECQREQTETELELAKGSTALLKISSSVETL